MIIELSQLPITMQQHILNEQTEIVQIVNNGQVIKNLQFSEPKSYANGDFDFDLERMKQAMKGLETPEERAKNSTVVPDWAMVDLASFDKWLASV